MAALLAAPLVHGQTMTGLPQIQHALYLDADADVMAPLRALAEQGDRTALQLLADLEGRSEDPRQIMQAIHGYRKSFANGRGSLASLSAMAQIADRVPLFRPVILAMLTEALPWADLYSDPLSVQAALDILLVFPELIPRSDWQQLLALHQRGCLESCRHPVHAGRFLESQGQVEAAREHYMQSMVVDARAVGLFQNSFAGDDELRHAAMLAYATDQLGNIEQHAAEPKASIAMALSRDVDTFDPTVSAWLDAAVESGSTDARIARIQMMLRLPAVFSFEDTLREIEAIADTLPTESQFLTAEAYMVKDWLSLDPSRTRDILLSLEASHPMRVKLALAELYTLGALDEPKPLQAMEIYQSLIAEHRSTAAYHRIAGLYAGTAALCDDRAAAWGYAQAALQLGQGGARRLLADLAPVLSEEQREQGERMAAELLTTLQARL